MVPRYTKDIIRCDRCGKEYEDPSWCVMWMQFQSFNCDYKFPIGTETYYLCSDCEKEFIDWFVEPDIAKKNPFLRKGDTE